MPAGARLVLLGGSRSLADYLEVTRVLRWIAGHDRKLHDHYLDEEKYLTRLQGTLQARRQEIVEAERTERQLRDGFATQRQGRLDLLQSILQTKAVAARAFRERRAARRSLAAMVQKLRPVGRQSVTFSRNRGRLPWPVLGEVSASYGQQVERESRSKTTQNGLDIRAKAGTRVQAIAAGRVVYADWLRGYGKIVILDHGQQYHSLMAHLHNVDVKVDDEVQQGTPLGTVGDTGSLRGTLLYFEIRQQGTPVDPRKWIR